MFRDKAEIATTFRGIARRVASGQTIEEAVRQINNIADRLQVEHDREEGFIQIINAGTVECRMCHGQRTTFDSQGRVQCLRCRGWGREVPEGTRG